LPPDPSDDEGRIHPRKNDHARRSTKGDFVIRKMDFAESRAYAIKSIRDFLEGTGEKWDWDDFISKPLGFPDLED
jgi:hypothetical protein